MRSWVLSLLIATSAAASAQSGFALHDGDRVLFYGDSITDNAPYTHFVETFVATRFPGMRVSFVNSGVGGDRVSGGGLGPIDQRLTRDMMAWKPTVVTIMLGMNDASYKPFDQGTLDTYEAGYRHIVDRIKHEIPNARVWLIRPSPFDDVTRAPGWDPGYNAVLKQYGDFVAQLASQSGFGIIDMNTPLVDMLEKAKAQNAELAQQIIPDRVHPTNAGHMAMAEAILEAWNAPRVVSKIDVDAKTGSMTTVNSVAHSQGPLQWTQTDKSLPWPLPHKDPLHDLVFKSSGVEALNVETLQVRNLDPGNYSLLIDNKTIGVFSADALGAGLDLTQIDTPMEQQAGTVANLASKRWDIQYTAWRELSFGLSDIDDGARGDAMRSMSRLEQDLANRERKAAIPTAHSFAIARISS